MHFVSIRWERAVIQAGGVAAASGKPNYEWVQLHLNLISSHSQFGQLANGKQKTETGRLASKANKLLNLAIKLLAIN